MNHPSYTEWRRTHPPMMGADGATDTEPVTPPPAEPAAPSLSGPWAQDIAASFSDPAVQAQVDAFLRGHVQPHVTKIEQEAAALKPAGELVTDLQTNPGETYLALTAEMYGDEAAAQVRQALAVLQGDAPPADSATPPAEPPPEAPLHPAVAELIAERQAARDLEQYNSEVAKLVERDPTVVPEELHPFVVSAEGDMELAYKGYQQWVSQVQQRLGGAPVDPAAPPVLGSDAAGSTVPPIQEKYGSLNEAMDAFFSERKMAAPSTVGNV